MSDRREQRTKAHSQGPWPQIWPGYAAPERNTCEEPLAAEVFVSAEVSVSPLSFAPLKLRMLASGMNDLTLSQQKGSLGHEAFAGD